MEVMELNYDAKRQQSTFLPDNFPFDDLPEGISVDLAIQISQRYSYVHKLFDELIRLHKVVCRGDGINIIITQTDQRDLMIGQPLTFKEYRFLTESLVFQFRRTADSLVQFADLQTQCVSESEVTALSNSGLESLLRPGGDRSKVYSIIMGDGEIFEKDETQFAETINELFNAMKHHYSHEESFRLISNIPNVVSYFVKHNDPANGVVFHNHNAYHLMMGYQDWVNRVSKNLKAAQ